MNKYTTTIIRFTWVALSATAFISCEEQALQIPDLSVGKRKVLVEELTGIRCQACPDGTRELNALQKTYGADNLIVVAVHAAGNFSRPYTDAPASRIDFRAPDIQQLADYIGTPEGFPTASVNRVLPDNASSLFLQRAQWSGLIAQQFSELPDIGVFIENAYDASTRRLQTRINLTPEKVLAGEHRLTVMILQDSIRDAQLDGQTRVADYMHRHVLRKVLTPSDGAPMVERLTPNTVVLRNYAFTLPDDWDVAHCSVVAFVHRGGSGDKTVLQAAEEKILR